MSGLFAIAKTWKQPKHPLTQRIKMREIMPSAATLMDLETVILSEVSQTEKEKYHMASLIYGI